MTEQKQEKLILGNLTIENITQRTVFIVGGKGSGKTQTLKMLLLSSPVPAVLFDTLNVVPKMEGTHRIVITRKNVDKGQALGGILTKLKYDKLVLSFIDFTQEESSKLINDIFTVWKPSHMLILVDEVHEVAPNNGMGLEYSTEFERAVRHWRNRDVGFLLSSQRPAFVSSKVKGLTDYMILYRVTYPNDLKVIKELISGMIPEQTDSVLAAIQTKPFLNGYGINFIP